MSSQKSRKHFFRALDFFFFSLLRYGRQLVQRLPLALSEAAITTLDRETMVMIYSMITLGVYYKIPPVFLNIQSFFLFFLSSGSGFFLLLLPFKYHPVFSPLQNAQAQVHRVTQKLNNTTFHWYCVDPSNGNRKKGRTWKTCKIGGLQLNSTQFQIGLIAA